MPAIQEDEDTISASSSKFRVTIIKDRCKECQLCINLCPAKVLVRGSKPNARGFRYPIPEFIEKCIGCKTCEWICPDLAIFVEVVKSEG